MVLGTLVELVVGHELVGLALGGSDLCLAKGTKPNHRPFARGHVLHSNVAVEARLDGVRVWKLDVDDPVIPGISTRLRYVTTVVVRRSGYIRHKLSEEKLLRHLCSLLECDRFTSCLIDPLLAGPH